MELTIRLDLALALVDDAPCWFDHRGGCQNHGYLDLDGQQCPQAELKQLIAASYPSVTEEP